jgi:uncharacterized membrane protein
MKDEIKNRKSRISSSASSPEIIIITIIFISAFLIRLVNINNKSLWLDECISILFAGKSLSELFCFLNMDVHPPLYYLLLKFFLLISSNPVFLRFISVFFGTLSIVVFYFTFRKRANQGALILTLIFLSISPLSIHYSQEIRMYAFLMFLVMLSVWAALRFVEGPELLPFLLFSLVCTALIYTHYFAGIFVIALLFYIAWERFLFTGEFKTALMDALRTGLLISIMYIPWLAVFFKHFLSSSVGGKHSQDHFSHISRTIVEYFTQIFGAWMPWAPFEKIILFKSNPWNLGSFGWLFFFLFIVTLFIFGFYKIKKTEGKLFRLFISTIGVGFLLTSIHLLLRGRFYSRCFIIYLPFIFYILSFAIINLPFRLLRTAAASYLGLCLILPASLYLAIDLRDVSLPLKKRLEEAAEKGEPVLHTSINSFFPVQIYLPEYEHYLIAKPTFLFQERRLAGENLIFNRREFGDKKRVWLVVEFWGKPGPWDLNNGWPQYWLGKNWTSSPVSTFSMGIKKCVLYKCDKNSDN